MKAFLTAAALAAMSPFATAQITEPTQPSVESTVNTLAQDVINGTCGASAQNAVNAEVVGGIGTGVAIYGYGQQLRARIVSFNNGIITPSTNDGMAQCVRSVAPLWVGTTVINGDTQYNYVSFWVVTKTGSALAAPPGAEREPEMAKINAAVFGISSSVPVLTAPVPAAVAQLTPTS